MMSGGQCVMTTGAALMPPQSVDSWDTHTLEVRKPQKTTAMHATSEWNTDNEKCFYFQVARHLQMPILEKEMAQYFLIMFNAVLTLLAFCSVPATLLVLIIVPTQMMQELGVNVSAQ